MKNKLIGLTNMIYGVLTCLYIIASNGFIRIPGSVDREKIETMWTVLSLVLLILGITMIVFNIIAMKKKGKSAHNCILICLAVAVCNVLAGLFMGGVTVFSVVSIIVGIVLIVTKD